MIILFTQKYDSWTLCGDEAYNKTEAAMTAKNRGYSRFLSNPKEEAVPLSYGRDVNDKLERNKDFRTPVDRISPEFRQIIRRTEEENGGRMNMGMDMNRNMHMNDSMVEFTLPNLSEYPLAMVYAPDQIWRNVYSPDEGLSRGTLFAELDKPFYPPRVCGGGR
ncbi:MAG: spore coat associated protein CotJA [Eubacteriales bacterium]